MIKYFPLILAVASLQALSGKAQQPVNPLLDVPQPQISAIVATEVPSTSSPAVEAASPATAGVSARATIMGTATDANDDLVPGALVRVDGPQNSEHHEAVTSDSASFILEDLTPGVPYRVSVMSPGFVTWSSPEPIVLSPGQHYFLTGVQLTLKGADASIEVYASQEQLAIEQVHAEMEQRVLGFVPNYYVVYDAKNAVAMTPKLKFEMAMKVSMNPVTVTAVFGMAGINQAANRLNYGQGAKGYGKRVGAEAAMGFSSILIGGAVLPTLLHQDPRYFYQGSGSTRSRTEHALMSPFICRGDNGKRQVNYSSLGGDLISTALTNTYFPDADRGAGTVFGTFALGTAERMLSAVAQEFILPRFTSHKKGAE